MRVRLIALIGVLSVVACEREIRELQPPPARTVVRTGSAAVESPVAGNAWGIAEGMRLYSWYNCAGCHSNGGGGMGPALMDDEWIYGSGSSDIKETILHGRPNGMPAFGGKIPELHAWQLAEYVRSMSGELRQDAAPGRKDALTPLLEPPPSIRNQP